MNTYTFVRDRIVQLLNEGDFSENNFADRSGISRTTLNSIMIGKSTNPTIKTLKFICDGFGISLFDFFNTDEFRSTEPQDE